MRQRRGSGGNPVASDAFCARPTFPLTDQSLMPAVGGRPSSTAPSPHRPPPWGFVRWGGWCSGSLSLGCSGGEGRGGEGHAHAGEMRMDFQRCFELIGEEVSRAC